MTCAALRLIPLFDYQFTYDELSGMERTQFGSFEEVIERGVKVDAHPAFVQLLIYYLTQIFGYVTWIIKLPFLLFGFGAVIYGYAFGLRNFSKQAGLFAALIFSFSLIFIFYAPIARMYISGVFFSVAVLYYFFEIFFQKDDKAANYFLLGFFAWLSALNQHINSLFAFTVCVGGLFMLDKKNYKAYLFMCLLVVLAYLPHMRVTLYQLSVPGIGRENGGWLEVPEFTVVFSFLKTLFGTGNTYWMFLVLVLLSFIFNGKLEFDKKRIFLLLLFVFNFLVVYAYTVLRTPIFQYSVMLFSGTAIILFLCSFIEFKKEAFFYVSLVLITSALLYKSYIKKDYLNQSVKTVYEYQFERTALYKSIYGDEHVYPVFCDADRIMKKIYFKKYNLVYDCKISSDSLISTMERTYYPRKKDPVTGDTTLGVQVSSLRLFSEFISGLKCDYLVISSSMPQQQAIVAEYFPYLIENTQTQAINYKVYSRKEGDRSKVVSDDKVDYYSSLKEKGCFMYSKENKVTVTKGRFSIKVDSLNEFPFDANAALSEVTNKEGQVVLVKAKIKLISRNSPLEICISETDRKTNEQYSYNSKAASDFLMRADSSVTMYSEYFNGFNYDLVKYKSNLNCYFWNRGKEIFELQDFEIKVIDYWPRKWDLWD